MLPMLLIALSNHRSSVAVPVAVVVESWSMTFSYGHKISGMMLATGVLVKPTILVSDRALLCCAKAKRDSAHTLHKTF